MSIEELLKYKNYNVEKDTFKYICENLQTSKIQYDIYQNCFGIWTNDGKYFCITIKEWKDSYLCLRKLKIILNIERKLSY